MSEIYNHAGIRLLLGDVRDCLRLLPDESVHCVVTSPPYWSLRDYGIEGQIGLEKTSDEYIKTMVDVFREVKRVLRDDGTCWVNLGDSYASGGKSGAGELRMVSNKLYATPDNPSLNCQRRSPVPPGLKPKNLVGIPWRVAFALQDDGWILRSDIIWHKPNPMPESVQDRPTKAHEYLFLLAKNERYFYDAEAIRESFADERMGNPGSIGVRSYAPGDRKDVGRPMAWTRGIDLGGRNRRSVWTIATEAFAEAHFATFPTALVKPCILAGTSEAGCCPTCGKPWVRVVKRTGGPPNNRFRDGLAGNCKTAHATGTVADSALSRLYKEHGYPEIKTTGFRPACTCGAPTRPAVVLDPFSGSGTTAMVAKSLGRHAIGIDRKAEYHEMAIKRLQQDVLPLEVSG